MGLREMLDKLLPVDTPEEVAKKIMEYGRKHPDMSEGEVLEMFSGQMQRAKRKKKERETTRGMEKTAAKRKMTQAEGKAKGGYAKKMNKGGYANCGASMAPAQKSTQKMMMGGYARKK